MTLIKPDGTDGAAREVFDIDQTRRHRRGGPRRVAAEHYQRTITAFQRSSDRIISGEEIPSPDYEKHARLFGSATTVLYKEKQKIEDSIKKDAGIVYDYAINFENAREEIRCRMARLRAARNAGSVSE